VVDLAGVFKLDDFEELARETLSSSAFAYYAGGAGDEVTLRDNVSAFRRRRLRPRVMVDVSAIDPSTSFLGTPLPIPVGLAPTAQHHFAHPEGEVATSRAAKEAGVLMCVSTIANRSLEDVAAVGPSPRWFQLYIHKDRGISRAMVERAAAAGYRAIVITGDLPYPGYRERELRHPVVYEGEAAFGNFEGIVDSTGAELMRLLDEVINTTVTWDEIEWVRELSGLPVLVKGILTGEDAALAVEYGAAGVVVSNHGGRQLDRVPASIDVLEEIVQEVAGRCEVYLDGGVRRGTDVAIALALGAQGVFIGRPYMFALAAAGEAGILRALELLREEFVNALGLLGATHIGQLGKAHLM
jgi:isopentenyl diphosphate isomerase/L-lactate dehydrogenase-like FMN-dependent dehydrogenase